MNIILVVKYTSSSFGIIFRLRKPRHFLYINKTILILGSCGVNINNKTKQIVLNKSSCSIRKQKCRKSEIHSYIKT